MITSDELDVVYDHMAAGRLEEAVAKVDDLLANHDDDARTWAVASWVRRTGVSATAGLEAARRAIELDPAYAFAHRMAASALNSLGRHPEARGAANEAIALAPDSYRAHAMRAEIDVAANDIDGVTVRAASRAVELAPDNSEVHRLLGAVLQRTGDERGMARSFERAVALGDEDVSLRLYIGLERLRRTRLNKAARDIAAVLNANPAQVLARAALIRILGLWLFPLQALLFVGCFVGLTTEGERVAITDPAQRPKAVVTVVPPTTVRTLVVDDAPVGYERMNHPLAITLLAVAIVLLVAAVSWNLFRVLGPEVHKQLRQNVRAAPPVALTVVGVGAGTVLFLAAAAVGGGLGRQMMIACLCLQFALAGVFAVVNRLSGGRAGRRQRLG